MPDRCHECQHPGKDCIPHLMALAATDLLTWCKERKKQLNLSNAEIAEKSGIPKGTIDRIFGKGVFAEFRFSTIQPVIRVLLRCNAEDFDCMRETSDQQLLNTIDRQKDYIETLEKEKAYLKAHEERYTVEMQETKRENAENLKALKVLCRIRLKIIIALSSVLFFTFAVIIIALLIDKANPDTGFFWRTVKALTTWA